MKLIYIFIMVIAFIVLGCEIIYKDNNFSEEKEYFEKEVFDSKYSQWEKLSIKNYSFKYIYKQNHNPDCNVIGNVTVVNGEGSVLLELEGFTEAELETVPETECSFPDEEDTLKSIDEVFEDILDAYNSTESSPLNFYIQYDDEYPIPIYAKIQIIVPSETDGDMTLYRIEIEDFVVH